MNERKKRRIAHILTCLVVAAICLSTISSWGINVWADEPEVVESAKTEQLADMERAAQNPLIKPSSLGDFTAQFPAGYEIDPAANPNGRTGSFRFDKWAHREAEVDFIIRKTGCSYTVSFDVNGGDSSNPADVVVSPPLTTVGEAGGMPGDPIRAGYDFAGWFDTDKDEGGNEFTGSTAVTGDITVYARWILESEPEPEYAVNFFMNDGSGNIYSSVAARNGTTVSAPAIDPVRGGYQFAGWYKEEAGINQWNFGQDIITGDTNVYAKWSDQRVFVITFDGNGAVCQTDLPAMEVKRPAATLAVLPSWPGRTGYTFNGWNTKVDGSGSIFNTSTVVGSNITVYAQWLADYYQLIFNLNGGNGSVPAVQSLRYGTLADRVPDPARSGAVFLGWNTAGDGSGSAWDFGTSTMPADNLTLYAQWRITGTTPPTAPGGGIDNGSNGGGGQSGDGGAAADSSGTTTTATTTATTIVNPTIGNTNGNNTGQAAGNGNMSGSSGTPASPLGNADVLLAEFHGGDTPLDGVISSSSWALVNIVAMIAGSLLAAAVLLLKVLKRQNDQLAAFIGNMVLGLMGIIVFILTENMDGRMIWIDKWTIIMILIVVVEAVCTVLFVRGQKDNDVNEDDESLARFYKSEV